jgi:hypothetical protein
MSVVTKIGPDSNDKPAAEPCSTGPIDLAQGRLTGVFAPTWFIAVATALLSTLREIFDESAYSRFLARHGGCSCPRAYAAFLREQEGIKARRPKCC